MQIKKILLFHLSILSLLSCITSSSESDLLIIKNNDELKETDYYKTQGLILKRIKRYNRYFMDSHIKGDIYYLYHINLHEPHIGILKNSELMFDEDDIIVVLVNKNDSSDSFISHRGIFDQELLYSYLTRNDSNFYRGKELVPFK